MNVLVYEPGKAEPKTVTIADKESDTLYAMQYLVGGLIQAATMKADKGTYLVVMDEEGKSKNKPLNRRSRILGSIVGTFFVCRQNGSEMVGLSDEDIEEVKGLVNEWFPRP